MPRDLIGYGKNPPRPRWPGNARIALSILLSYEEGAENLHQDGVGYREMNGEAPSPVPAAQRDLANESMFEYGSRVGIWRLLRIVANYDVKLTVAASALAFERNPHVAQAVVEAGHDIVAHGYRWEEAYKFSKDQERESISKAHSSLLRTTGRAPKGWLNRYGPSESTRELLVEHGGFIFDSNGYNDDLPYYTTTLERPWLVVPYGLTLNDMRFYRAPGYATGDDFFKAMKENFDMLYDEGAESPKMMSVGLHARISGWPGRASSVDRFLEYTRSKPGVWYTGRTAVAEFWLNEYAPEMPAHVEVPPRA